MKKNYEVRHASSARETKGFDTTQLREEFLIQNLLVEGEINFVYSHYDRFITGGAVPTSSDIKLRKSVV